MLRTLDLFVILHNISTSWQLYGPIQLLEVQNFFFLRAVQMVLHLLSSHVSSTYNRLHWCKSMDEEAKYLSTLG